MGIVFNRKEHNEKRIILRNSMSKAEILLWNELKGRRMKGLKFRRQYGVGKYVIDFYCPEIKLAIEADGNTHNSDDEIKYDNERQSEIENFGIYFLRIKNEEIIGNIKKVIRLIECKIEEMNN